MDKRVIELNSKLKDWRKDPSSYPSLTVSSPQKSFVLHYFPLICNKVELYSRLEGDGCV